MQQTGQQKKKKVQKSMTESKVELVDIIYCYGREQTIESMGENTPLDVLRAYEELRKLRQERGEDYPPMHFVASSVKEMQLTVDKETSKVINEKCFKFVQQLIMKIHESSNRRPCLVACTLNGVFKACSVAYFQEMT